MTATTSVKLQILNQATQLQQWFTQAKENIDKMTPSEQIIATTELQNDSALISQLQQRVHATFLQQAQAIPGMSEEELLALSEKLRSSAEILDSIDSNNMIAMSFVDIASEIERLHQSSTLDHTRVRSLQGRITDLRLSNSFLNRGNREAIDVANQALQSMLTQQTTSPSQPPVIQSRAPTLSEDQQIRQATDEDFQASLFTDQYRDLESALVKDPVQDFDKVLAYYVEVKKYSISKTSYVSEAAGPIIVDHLQKAEGLLNQWIQEQVSNENEQLQQTQGQASQYQTLNELKQVIEQGLASSNILSHYSKIDEVFSKLSLDEKQNFLSGLDDIQMSVSKRNLPKTLLGQSLTNWPATWSLKKAVIEKILSASNESTTPVSGVHKADGMKRRLNEAKNMQPVVQSSSTTLTHTTTQPTAPSMRTDLLDDDISAMDIDDVGPFSFQASSTLETHPNLVIIYELQTILPHLGPYTNGGQQLQEACQVLQMIDSQGVTNVFKMSDTIQRAISGRPLYHIYSIHKNESPEKLKEDMQYGDKAFSGAYPATDVERLRSVQRTIVELVLEDLEDAINFDDGATLIQLLDILENLKLDVKDRAEEQENAAYNLFGVFYHLHVAARNSNTSLINPNDSQFHGDFGREAFRRSMTGIDPAIKIAAINQVRNSLKAVWKL